MFQEISIRGAEPLYVLNIEATIQISTRVNVGN